MHRQSGFIIHEHAVRMHFKNIWAELSYEFGPSCLVNLGRVGMAEFYVGRVGMGRVGLGRVVRNSLCCDAHRNSLVCLITQLSVVCPIWVFSVIVRYRCKRFYYTFRDLKKPGCLLGDNSDHFHCL